MTAVFVDMKFIFIDVSGWCGQRSLR
jgi:hypothetical protein